MIKFPCHCGHPFEFPDDMAGGMIQCPRCGRLNDVPTADELKTLADDGTIRLDESPVQAEINRLAHLHHTYSKDKVDADGDEIDLRQTLDELVIAGDEPPPPQDAPRARSRAPKYDPVTGVLIRPLDIAPVEDAPIHTSEIPLAKATLEYAPVRTPDKLPLLKPAGQMFKLVNVVVILFVLAAHVAIVVCLLMIGLVYAVAIVWLPGVLAIALLAHIPNIIEDIGPAEKDEIPRLMRDFSANDDFIHPLMNFLLSIVYCYGPLMVIQAIKVPDYLRLVMTVGYSVFGTLIFPAVLLTAVTSGAIVNLRPDRVWKLIGVIGIRYVFLVALFAVSMPMYLLGWFGTMVAVWPRWWPALYTMHHAYVPGTVNPFDVILSFPACWAWLAIGMVLMNYWCCCMGLAYRRGHADFPWEFQRHHRDPTRFLGAPGRKPVSRLPLPDERRMRRPRPVPQAPAASTDVDLPNPLDRM